MAQRMVSHPTARSPLRPDTLDRVQARDGQLLLWREDLLGHDLDALTIHALVSKSGPPVLPYLFFPLFLFSFLALEATIHIITNTLRRTTTPAACPHHLQVKMKVYRQFQRAPTWVAMRTARC